MCFSHIQPCPCIVAVLLCSTGGCTLNVLAQIMFNVLLVLALGFLRSQTINTENQDRTAVSLRQGRQLDVVSEIIAGMRKGEALPVSAAAVGPCAALASSAAEVDGLLGILLIVPGDTEPGTSCRCIIPSAWKLCRAPCPALHQVFWKCWGIRGTDGALWM